MLRFLPARFTLKPFLASFFTITICLCLSGNAIAQFTPGNLAVTRIGDGVTVLSSSSAPVAIIEYTTSGVQTYSVALPSTGSPQLTNSGSATSEGNMELSAERDRLVIAGYDAPATTAVISGTTAAADNRELFSMDHTGAYSKVAYSTTLYNTNNIRSGTASGANYFSAGATSGINLLGLGTGTSLTATPTTIRAIQVLNGQTYFSSSSGTFVGVSKVGTGIPTTTQTSTLITPTINSAYGFSLSPDGNTLYVADDGGSGAGTAGVSKYTLIAGAFVLSYRVTTTFCRGLAVDYSGTNPVIYATTAALTSQNTIISMTDAGGPATPTTIVTAGPGYVFRGLTFSPSCYATIAVSGASTICSGSSASLTIKGNPTATVSYQLNSGTPQTATIGNNGLVTISTGALSTTTTVNLLSISTYACSSVALSGSTATATITVNPSPSITSIAADPSVCSGGTLNLSGTITSGTAPFTYAWTGPSAYSSSVSSSLSANAATVPSISTTPVNPVYTLTVTDANSCTAKSTATTTVNPSPSVFTLSPGGGYCPGQSVDIQLSGSQSGVNYQLYNGGSAAGGSMPGTTSPIDFGYYTAGTYTALATNASSGCTRNMSGTASVALYPLPAVITGTMTVCQGQTTTLSDATTPGTWSSDATGIATVAGSTGVVTGVSAGTADISFTSSLGCSVSTVVTVNPLSPVTGTAAVCMGSFTTLSDATPSGTWSSSATGTAIIDGSGQVTPVAQGTATISYTLATGCVATVVVTVNPLPSPIVGTPIVCQNSTITLSDPDPSGSWTSGTASVATVVSGTGVVTGVSGGNSIITYTLPTGCMAFTTATVNPLPAAIAGSDTICNGLTTTLTDGTGAGTWASSNTATATVGSTGLVTSLATGTTTISYTLPTGCFVTQVETVNPLPGTIAGSYSVCVGSTVTLSDGSFGGTWSSSNTTAGTIGSSSGIVSGTASGSTTITYTLPTGCIMTAAFTVNPVPAVITGTTNVCVGLTTTLNDITPLGTWSSSATGIATVGTSGDVYGSAQGSATITYMLPTGCLASLPFTVNPLPANITGTVNVCEGLSTTLHDATTPGTWSSSTPGIASIGTSGTVFGASQGSATITYTLPTGCIMTTPFTVNPVPAVITGTPSVCFGLISPLADATSLGTWSSSATGIAIVSGGGGVFGASAGSATITYALSTGCIATTPFTVNPLPANITGTTNACVGLTSTLSDATPLGTWSSSASGIASVGTSGDVLGVGQGSATITYTLPTGCMVTTPFNVNPLPATITGTTNVCVGLTSTLTDSPTPGTWSSSAAGIATVGTSGAVFGVSQGSATITYRLSTGCIMTTPFTVNPLPATITGTFNVCAGLTTTLSDGTPLGNWSSSATGIATAGTAGDIYGVSQGSATITYTLPTGCIMTTPFTVNPLPATIGGTLNVCVGQNTTLTDGSGTGTWTSGTPGVATIGSSNGIVNGVGSGTDIVTFTLPTGCLMTTSVTVNGLPSAIAAGAGLICQGATVTLSDGSGGGAWSSSNTTVGTVGSVSGDVTGLSPGTTTITFTLPTGCIAKTIITVNLTPVSIVGSNNNVCVNSTISLTDGTSGGTWSSNVPSVASVGTSGIVSGLSSGNVFISYTMPTGCNATYTVTVNDLPATISGSLGVCTGQTTNLSDTDPGGTWVSSAPSYASVGSTGIVTGNAPGTATITYTLPTTCITHAVVTVNNLPAVITGTLNVCVNSTTTLTDATGGGTWGSSNTLVATVGSTGLVTGIGAGTATITYTLGSTGCSITTVVTVNSLPASISGNMSVCVNGTTALTDGSGTWSSATPSFATVGSTGIVSGVSAGTATIVFTAPTGCTANTIVTVNPLPGTINGTFHICQNATTTLTDGGGGTWISSDPTIASITLGGGLVNGIAQGSVSITYTLPFTGCAISSNFTVNALPAAIAGTMTVCATGTTLLTDAGGGTWVSNSLPIATVGSSGLVTGVSGGSATITYTLATGCTATAIVTVNPLPGTITGTLNVCVNATTNLVDGSGGGTWTSGTPAIASVNSGSGVTTGITQGSATITYTLSTGCSITAQVTVNPLPNNITGADSVCVGSTVVLAGGPGSGAWTSAGSASIAAIGLSSGTVTGIASGNIVVTFTLGTGCYATFPVTVNPLPANITGGMGVCAGFTSALADGSPSGAWTSSNPAAASVGSSGIVSGNTVGATATITYTLPTGCLATATVTVNPLPNPISGNPTVCAGASNILSDIGVGTWSSSNTTIATIDGTTGAYTGVAAGTATITYTLGTGCTKTIVVSVNAQPSPISGNSNVCLGSGTTLSESLPGGTWSSPSSNVTVGSTGIITGSTIGTAVVTYQMPTPTSCYVTDVVTVNPLPPVITGDTLICVGSSYPLSNAITGGTWSLSTGIVGNIGLTSGIVTGIYPGIATVTYTPPSGCAAHTIVTVNPLPAPITGTTHVCINAITALSDTGAGTWSSSNPSKATVNSSGLVTGVFGGSSTITYTINATGCIATTLVTVNILPSDINGDTMICAGLSGVLHDFFTGGTWSSGDTAIATITSGSGVVTGVVAGSAMITFTLPTGCSVIARETVMPLPTPVFGSMTVCEGDVTTIFDTTSGGMWSASSGSASVSGAGSVGTVTGISAGTATITYTLATGCLNTAIVTVNPIPAPITGVASVCEGYGIVLDDATPGGIWASNSFSIFVNAYAGVVIGFTADTATVTYTLATGCMNSVVVTVNALPGAISGPSSVCPMLAVTLSDTPTGGTWSSSDTTIASVGLTTGIVTGVASGSTNITYTSTGGCTATTVMTVTPPPPAITGTPRACPGAATVLGDPLPGGTWSILPSSSDIATIDVSGIVTGVSVGSAVVTYIAPVTGCITTVLLTVNPLPAPITGSASLCIGSTSHLSDSSPGGIWGSSNISIAPVSGVTGIVTGMAVGSATITYRLGTGCVSTTLVIVNPMPPSITGNHNLCIGSLGTFTDASAGGTWASSNLTVATIDVISGVASGLGLGTTTLTYTTLAGCTTTTTITVDPLPAVPTEASAIICSGLTTTVSDVTPGGAWSTGNAGIATVTSGGGVVTGIAGGIVNISYVLPTGCASAVSLTVVPYPSAISGNHSICLGGTSALSDVPAGGTWSTPSSSVITLNGTTGLASGIAVGTAAVTYTLMPGCFAATVVQVVPLPNVHIVFGGGSYCAGGSGVPIALDGSDVGTSYLLYFASSVTGYAVGTGDTIHFPLSTVAGTYTVQAVNSAAGCTSNMNGSAVVIITPIAVPSVSVTANMGDTVCPGTTVLFTPVPLNGGLLPTYFWRVNGTAVSTANTYSFIPANGDVVQVMLTSNAACAMPDTASGRLKMTVPLNGAPMVSISAIPGDTVCQYASAVFTANPEFGGYTPVYTWYVNNAPVGTAGQVFGYVPNTGDIVSCKMTSDYRCRLSDTGYSNSIEMYVMPMIVPHVQITTPALNVDSGKIITLTAVATDAGTDPGFQWELNGTPIFGATNATYSSSFNDNDSVTCMVTSSGVCNGITTFDWVFITVHDVAVSQLVSGNIDIRLMPNPNKGMFTLKGKISNVNVDEEVSLSVSDMLGQEVYTHKLVVTGGRLNEQVILGDLPNGMYLLNLRTSTENTVFHFVVEK